MRGGSISKFLQLGFAPKNLYGIDIIEERIDQGKNKYPNIHFTCDDASRMPYESNMFNLCLSSTMFVQITDENLAQRIADEMLRVTKKMGYILLIDWRYSKPWDSHYLGLSKKRMTKLFSVGIVTNIISQTNGAMVPQIGRFVSKYLPMFYFLLKSIFPFLVGQQCTLLQKK